jgi:pyruvate/2-oxoglutarate dehydrogenase complex dihydrolipoamide dehydrogenase (E3) component
MCFEAPTIILAMGCRERNRGNIGIPGTRPAGVYTAGLAQRLINIEGYMPGKDIVIIGSGDIGLIMARRMTWAGAKVHGVIEILPYPSGLTRNIVQCLNDFNIPLYLSHAVSQIIGKDRVEGIIVNKIIDGVVNKNESFRIDCDTVLLSVGLIPDNELSLKADIQINDSTGGAIIDANLMTNISGIFACGNVLHVHDLVDNVSQESQRCADAVKKYLNGKTDSKQIPVDVGMNLKYVLPNKVDCTMENILLSRPLIVKDKAKLILKTGEKIIFEKKYRRVQPSEMISLEVGPELLKDFKRIEVSLR